MCGELVRHNNHKHQVSCNNYAPSKIKFETILLIENGMDLINRANMYLLYMLIAHHKPCDRQVILNPEKQPSLDLGTSC